MAEKKHAWRSPSKGDLWVNCTGGLEFIRRHQDQIDALGRAESTEAATQGTLGHQYAEATILASFHPDESGRRQHEEVAIATRPQLKPEILKNAELYIQWVKEYLVVGPHGGAWGLELSAPLWYEPESKGTADFWAIEDGETLLVLDYKSGRGEVEVKNNIQIAIYLIAIYDQVRRFYPKLKKFRAGVLQPFVDPQPKFWEFDLGTLESLREMIGAAAREVEDPFLGYHTLTVTEKGCRFCPAKPICPARREQAESLLGGHDLMVEATPPEKLFQIYKSLPMLRNYLDEVEDYIRDQPDEVLATNGFIRKDGRRSYHWTQEDALVASELRKLGIEPFETKLKSPAKIKAESGTADLPVIESLVGCDFTRPQVVSVTKDAKGFRAKHKRDEK